MKTNSLFSQVCHFRISPCSIALLVALAWTGLGLCGEGEGGALETLLERLLARRKRVPDLLREISRGRIDPFPNWA